MTSFTLKILAAIFMIMDHTGDAILGRFSILNLFGRLAFPIFAYQLVQGYIYTKNKKKHLLKLLLFAIISEIPFKLFLSTFTNEKYINVLFTFFLATLVIYICEKVSNKYLKIIVIVITSIISQLLKADYGVFGIILVYTFYYFETKNIKNKKMKLGIITFLLCNLKWIQKMFENPSVINTYLMCGIFTSLSIFFINAYNQKEGPKLKFFFYILYPLHMLILSFIHNNI